MPSQLTALLSKLDMNVVREHYWAREVVHRQLNSLYSANDVTAYVNLSLGISNPVGNYSAAEHHLGPRILDENTEQQVFDLAKSIAGCASPHHLPETVYQSGLPYLKISVGSEMAMMLKPDRHWVGNKRTVWCHLLVKHNGSTAKANEELKLYYDNKRDSEMDYQIWRDIYLALEANLLHLGRDAAIQCTDQGVLPGKMRFMWPDAVATFLFDKFAAKR